MGGARLTVLPIFFEDVIILIEAENENLEIPEMIQALSQAAGNPEAHLEIMTG